jgi:hypothetical protein
MQRPAKTSVERAQSLLLANTTYGRLRTFPNGKLDQGRRQPELKEEESLSSNRISHHHHPPTSAIMLSQSLMRASVCSTP